MTEDRLAPSAHEWLETLPPERAQILRDVLGEFLDAFPDVQAVCAVGSLAEGSYDEHSDLDFVLCHPVKYAQADAFARIRDKWPHVGFNFFTYTPEKLHEAFSLGGEGAWAIHRGMVLYDHDGSFSRYVSRQPPLPTGVWIRSRLCDIVSCPSRGGGVQGKVLALVQILLVMRCGIMLTTKKKIREAFLASSSDELAREAVDTATNRNSPWDYTPSERVMLHKAIRMLYEEVQRELSHPDKP